MNKHERGYSIGRATEKIRSSTAFLSEKARKTLSPRLPEAPKQPWEDKGDASIPHYENLLTAAGFENTTIINQKEQTIVVYAERPDGQRVIVRDDFFGTSVTAFQGEEIASPGDESTFWDGRTDMARSHVLTALAVGKVNVNSPLHKVLSVIEELKEKSIGFEDLMPTSKEASRDVFLGLGPEYVTLFEIVYALEMSGRKAQEQREDLQNRLLEERKRVLEAEKTASYRRVNIVGERRASRLELGLRLLTILEDENAPEIIKVIAEGMGEIRALGPDSFDIVDYTQGLIEGSYTPLIYAIDPRDNSLSSPIRISPKPFDASDFPSVNVW